jgi:antirestriction protein ArdC
MASKQLNNKALDKFAELMIEKIQQVSEDWKRPWITNPVGRPRNAITNRPYSGFNDLALYFETERRGYPMPAYLTYMQASEAGGHVKKGSTGFPVIYWLRDYVNKADSSIHIKADEYAKLSAPEKENYKQRYLLKEFTVFNVEQTTIPEEKPELYEKIKSRFGTVKLNDENGMMKSPALDDMLQNDSWFCRIEVKQSNKAFYRPLDDSITVPLKAQFVDGEKFYGTLLHEMAHSTGAASRLNREKGYIFGDEKYAKEELVAELTAALTASSLSLSTGIKEENAMYLKNWLGALKTEPNFILSLLSDVNKASNMILDKVDIQEDVSVDLKPKIDKPDEVSVFGLEKDNLYRFDADNKAVMFTGVQAGGVLNFKYMDSGKTFQLLTNGKPPKHIKPYQDYDIDIMPVTQTTKKQLFELSEIPAGELKKAGVKFSGLSEVDKQRLMKGRETKAMNIVIEGGKSAGTLSLLRNPDNSVSLLIKPVQEKVSKGIRM